MFPSKGGRDFKYHKFIFIFWSENIKTQMKNDITNVKSMVSKELFRSSSIFLVIRYRESLLETETE